MITIRPIRESDVPAAKRVILSVAYNIFGVDGSLRRLDEKTAALKRMWLLDAYYGQGIGYRLITNLFEFARVNGCIHIRLQTSVEQVRALLFYWKLGFYEIPCDNDGMDEISMEVGLVEC